MTEDHVGGRGEDVQLVAPRELGDPDHSGLPFATIAIPARDLIRAASASNSGGRSSRWIAGASATASRSASSGGRATSRSSASRQATGTPPERERASARGEYGFRSGRRNARRTVPEW